MISLKPYKKVIQCWISLPSPQAQKVEPIQETSTYQHQNVWHNNVLIFCAIGQVWLEEKSPVLQVRNGIIVVECDICFIPVLPAKRGEIRGTYHPWQSTCSLRSKNGLHRPGLAAGGDQRPVRSQRQLGRQCGNRSKPPTQPGLGSGRRTEQPRHLSQAGFLQTQSVSSQLSTQEI